jgi:hypothetical protein
MNRLAFASSLFLSLAVSTFTFGAEKKKPAKAPTKAEPVASAGVSGWLDWRGPFQTGVSLEKGLPDKVDAKQPLWTADFPGQSAPVIANGKLYIMGFEGEGRTCRKALPASTRRRASSLETTLQRLPQRRRLPPVRKLQSVR